MLNIKVNRLEFLKGIQIVEKAAFENKIRPILSGIYLEAKGKNIILKSTDLEIIINVVFQGDVISEGKVVFHYHLLEEYLKACNAETVILIENESGLKIKTNDSTTEMLTYDVENYPTINIMEDGDEYYLLKEDFLVSLESTKIAAATTADNLAINCVRVELESSLMKMIATDSFRMIYKETKLKGDSFPPKAIKVSIPLKTVDILIKTLKVVEGEAINFKYNGNQILITIGETSISSRIIDLEFPDYKSILENTNYNKKIYIRNKDFVSVLKRVLIFVRDNRESKNSAIFEFKENKLYLKGISEIARINEVVDTLKDGDNIKISLNVKFILDFITQIGEKNIELNLANSNRPLFIKEEKRDDFVYLTMPLALREE